MKPARPFHINYPRRYPNGDYAESECSFQVVGHRDGPVVAEFPFDPKEPEYVEQAQRLAEALAADEGAAAGLLAACERLDLTCQADPLNPCWNNRPSDVPGKHWGVGEACPACSCRAAIALARGGK